MKVITVFFAAIVLLTACKQRMTPGVLTAMVPNDSANKMINSYLNSINYSVNDTDLQSLTLDADAFRAYLDDPVVGSQVDRFRISFAHTLNYINSGHGGQNAGYRSGALTLVVVGLDETGNTVYYPGGQSINNATHCPPSCGLAEHVLSGKSEQ